MFQYCGSHTAVHPCSSSCLNPQNIKSPGSRCFSPSRFAMQLYSASWCILQGWMCMMLGVGSISYGHVPCQLLPSLLPLPSSAGCESAFCIFSSIHSPCSEWLSWSAKSRSPYCTEALRKMKGCVIKQCSSACCSIWRDHPAYHDNDAEREKVRLTEWLHKASLLKHLM